MYSFYDYMPHMAEGGQPQEQHEDSYAGMAMGQLAALQEKAAMLRQFLNPQTEIDPWVASKITLADDYITSVTDYLKHGEGQEEMPNPGGPEPNGAQEYPEGQEPPMARWGGRYQTGGTAQGGQDDEVQQVIQVYSQLSGIKPDEIMQKLQAMKPAQQKKAYTEMKKAVVTAMQKQQTQPQAQEQDMAGMEQQSMQAPQQGMMMRNGGYYSHDGSYRQAMGSGTNSGNAYYAYGGNIIPNYMKESSPMYNFGGYFPQGPRFEDGGSYDNPGFRALPSAVQQKILGQKMYGGGMYEDGGQTQDGAQMGMIDVYKKGGIYIKPSHRGRFTEYKKRTGKTTEEALHSPDPHVRQMANFARNAAKWKHEDGGIVNGQVINNVTPDMLQELKRGGYSYEIIND